MLRGRRSGEQGFSHVLRNAYSLSQDDLVGRTPGCSTCTVSGQTSGRRSVVPWISASRRTSWPFRRGGSSSVFPDFGWHRWSAGGQAGALSVTGCPRTCLATN